MSTHPANATTASDRLSEHFDAFADTHRRLVVEQVAEHAGPLDLDALVRRVAARDPERSTDGSLDELRLRLHHVHLPKLAALDVLAYDVEAREVTAGPAIGTAREFLRAVPA